MNRVTECPIDAALQAAGIAIDNGSYRFAIAVCIAILDSREKTGIQRVKARGILDGIRYEAECLTRSINDIVEDDDGEHGIPAGHISLYRIDADLDFEFDSDSEDRVHGSS